MSFPCQICYATVPQGHNDDVTCGCGAVYGWNEGIMLSETWAALEIVRLRDDLVEALEAAFCVITHEETSGRFVGWWGTCTTTAVSCGDRLVKLGLWERHPDGVGRMWWYRPKVTEAAPVQGSVEALGVYRE